MAKEGSAGIGRRLHAARLKRGLSLVSLGQASKLSASGVNAIEKAHSIPGADTIESLARALGVDPCWLAYGTGNKPDFVTS